MARIPAPASSPGLPASLLRKLNTAQVFFSSTHLESLGFRICVKGSGPQSLCCLHPRGDKCPPRPMYLLPFYTGVSRGAALERDLRPPLFWNLVATRLSGSTPPPFSRLTAHFVPCEPQKPRV